ncbi:hypothetical protein G6F42_028896 [Rhizopus arrhizus]|nr:hypothetical protein G6F42_028896 [Rhizopus arrhizus]
MQDVREKEMKLQTKDDEIADLQEVVEAEKKKRQEIDAEFIDLRKEVLKYKGEIHERTLAHQSVQSKFGTLEATLAKEVEERKQCQKKNVQLERDVDMLTKLVQSEAKESRARADRLENMVASLLRRNALD